MKGDIVAVKKSWQAISVMILKIFCCFYILLNLYVIFSF